MVNKRKKYNARFAPARIKKIMQKDEEIGKVAAAVPVIISRALELFVESLVKKAEEVTRSRSARTLTPAHLKASILTDPRLYFLRETIANVPDVLQDDDGEPGSMSQSLPPGPPSQPLNSVGRSSQRGRTLSNRSGGHSESAPENYPTHHANGSNPFGYYGLPQHPSAVYPGMSPSYAPTAHSGMPQGPMIPPGVHMPPQAHSQYSHYPHPDTHGGQYPLTSYPSTNNPGFGHFAASGYPMTPAVPCQGEDEDYDQ